MNSRSQTKEKTIVSDREIVRNFAGGLSIEVLAAKVATSEQIGKREAKIKVERALYADEMMRKRAAKKEEQR